MSELSSFDAKMIMAHDRNGSSNGTEDSFPSKITAISPYVEKLMRSIRNRHFVPEALTDVEIALREALANAVIHGNHQDPKKSVYVSWRFRPGEVSITVRDEGKGFDVNQVGDPTASENLGSVHGRGIYMMKALMDEVCFDEGGTVVRMRKKNGNSKGPARSNHSKKSRQPRKK